MKPNIESLKRIPISDVLEFLGYSVTKSGKWLSVRGDNSLKCDVSRNMYYDFSGRLGKGSVIDLVMQTQGVDFKRACEILSQRFLINIAVVDNQKQVKNSKVMKKYIDESIVQAILDSKHYSQNSLSVFLSNRLGVCSERLASLDVGTSRAGHAVFLYRNIEGRYEFLKVVPYDKTTGKRTGNILTPKGYTQSEGYTANCFFNEYSVRNAEYVFVVESEKTAVIGTVYFNNPSFAFVATGGSDKLSSLLRNRRSVLEDRKVILLPDNDDAGLAWIDVAKQFKEAYEELYVWLLDADSPPKSDLADFILGESETWKVTFKNQFNKIKGNRSNAESNQPMLNRDVSDTSTLPPALVNKPKELVNYERIVATTKSESQRFWEDYDAKQREHRAKYENCALRLTKVKDFFDKQVLPDEVFFFNDEGKAYARLESPNQYVMRCLSIAEKHLSEKNERGFDTYCCYLEQLQQNIVSGRYFSYYRDEVPF